MVVDNNISFNFSNFMSSLIFHPNDGEAEKDWHKALAATIVIGIMTIGLAHLLIRTYTLSSHLYNRRPHENKNNLNPTEEKTEEAFKKTDPGKNSVPSKNEIKPQPVTIRNTRPTTPITPTAAALPPPPKELKKSQALYAPDTAVVQYILADFVGGGEGNSLGNGVSFYKHYFQQYCKEAPEDVTAATILKDLNSYFSPSLNTPLHEATNELIKELKEKGSIIVSGGYHQVGGGHAILYQFILEDNGTVTFKITNSGEGLQYHPVDLSSLQQWHSIRDWHYRTLTFKGATIEQLKEVQFFDMLLSFNRPRTAPKELNITLPTRTNASDEALYQAIVHSWPGVKEIAAENPGGAQRANSCSIHAITKWIRGRYSSSANKSAQTKEQQKKQLIAHHTFSFWIKISALSDYLTHIPNHSSQFINDAVHKISSHAVKMKKEGTLNPHLIAEWNEVCKRASNAIQAAQADEKEKAVRGSLQLPEDGSYLSRVDSVKVEAAEKKQKEQKIESPYSCSHLFPVDEADTGERLRPFLQDENAIRRFTDLSKRYISPLMDEMAYRLNLLRILPDCNSFDFEKHIALVDKTKERKEFFTELASLCKYFYYTNEAASTLHLPDSFVVDVMNGWMIVFLEAKKEEVIPEKVLLEWLDGVRLLLKQYENEYIFDSPQSEWRFQAINAACTDLYEALLTKIQEIEKNYTPISNAWHIYGKPEEQVDGKIIYNRTPFYYAVTETTKKLPAAAEFAYQTSQQYIEQNKDSPEAGINHYIRLPRKQLVLELPEDDYQLLETIKNPNITFEQFSPAQQQKIEKIISPFNTHLRNLIVNGGDSSTAVKEIQWSLTENYKNKKIKEYTELLGAEPHESSRFLLYFYAQHIKSYLKYEKGESYDLTIKQVASFGLELPHIPYYDLLREGLTLLFGFADRHLSRSSDYMLSSKGSKDTEFNSQLSDLCRIQPVYYHVNRHFRGESPHCSLEPKYSVSTTHPNVAKEIKRCYFPETHLPKAKEIYQRDQELNERIQAVILSEENKLPFLKPYEEKEWTAFVQKDPSSTISEALSFFKDKLHRLAQPDYQSTFEHLLFSRDGFRLLTSLFSLPQNPINKQTIGLLFDFIDESCDTLLKRNPKIQIGAPFLLQMGLRLVQIAKFHQWPTAAQEEARLLKRWEQMTLEGKENPVLGAALFEAMAAAAPSFEFDSALLKNSWCLELMARTALLGCIPAKLKTSKYDALALHYGFLSFKELLNQSADKDEIVQKAAKTIFGQEEASNCRWSPETNQLQLKSMTLDLYARRIEGNDDFNMAPLPKKIREDSDFKEVFGKQLFLATVEKQVLTEVYTFSKKGSHYQIVHDESGITIQKEINGNFYSYQEKGFNSSQIKFSHSLSKKYLFWRDGETIYGEDRKTGEINIIGDEKGFRPLQNGKKLPQRLGVFSRENDLLRSIFHGVEDANNIVVWKDKNSDAISRVQLFGLGLEFATRGPSNKQELECVNFPGFKIAQNQFCAFLGNVPGTIVLENKKGQKKVIVPTKRIKSNQYRPYQKETFVQIETETNGHSIKRGYVAFDVPNADTYPDLSPSPDNILPLTLLLSIYIATKQYDKALKLITYTQLTSKRHVDSDTKYLLESLTKDLFPLRWGSDFQKTKDLHPAAVSLRLSLYAWRHKVSPIVFKESDQTLHLKQELALYQNLFHSLGPFLLPDSIIDTLNGLAKIYERPIASSKNVSYGKTFERNEQLNISAGKLLPLREGILRCYAEKQPAAVFSLTSPGEEFILQFLNNYEIAIDGSIEEKNCLKRQLALSYMEDSDSYNRPLIELLVSAFLDPSLALSASDMINLFNCETKEDFIKALDDCLANAKKIIKDKGSKIYLSEWIRGKFDQELLRYGRNFVSSGKKLVGTNPGRALLEENFIALPEVDIEPLDRPLEMNSLHKELLTAAPAQPLAEEIKKEKAALEKLDNWITKEIAKNKDNAAVRMQFERLKKGTDACQRELQVELSAQNTLSQDLPQIKLALDRYDKEISDRKGALEREEQQILSFANNLHGNDEVSLEILCGQRDAFDIETLLIALGRGDKTAIQNGNPTLSQQEIVELMEKVGRYALLKSESQQFIRCEKKLRDYSCLLELSKNKESLYAAAQDYLSEAEARRCYNPSSDPRLLIFELLGDLVIRQEQKDALLSLNGQSAANKWKLFEARTGFGKSKVLLPLWLLLATKSDSLAIMTVHANLFDQQEGYLQKVFKGAYRFFGVRIDFSRESPASKEDIEEIEAKLRRAQRLRLPVFMSDQTLHNLLILKPKEIAGLSSSADNHASLGAFLSLRRYVKQKGHLFADEPQKVLNDSEESNYSIGQKKNFGKERIKFGLSLYIHLFDVIKDRYRLECWQGSDPKAKDLPLLTEEKYRKEVLKGLLKRVTTKEKIALDESGKRYLKGKMSFTEQKSYEENLTKEADSEGIKTKIRILHDQLHSYLPQTLIKHSDEDYAIFSSLYGRSAVPVESVRNPKEGNEFVLVDQILNFTIQANLNTPFPEEFIGQAIDKLAEEAAEEIDKGADNVSETLAYKKFCLLFDGKPWCGLLKMRPVDYQKLCRQINESLRMRLQFIGLTVLPSLCRYDEKITSNPHLLVHCFNKVAGASGTLSMHHLPHQFTVEADERAIVKTLAALVKKYDEFNESVVEFASHSSQEVTADLLNKIPKASVVLEVGAVMRDYPSLLELAKDLLEKSPGFDGIAAFDSRGVPIVLLRGHDRFIEKEQAEIATEKLLWFYGQKDTTGTDQKLPPFAKAALFINEETTLTELIQGAGRMRSLLAKQQVVIALDLDSASLIKKALDKDPEESLLLFDIFTYCAVKEGEKCGLANFHSLSKQWNALLENAFWDGAIETEAGKVAEDFQRFRQQLVDANLDEPLEKPSISTKAVKIDEALAVQRSLFEKKRAAMENKAIGSHMEGLLAGKLNAKKIEPAMESIQKKMTYPNEMRISEEGTATQQAQATVEQQAQGIEEVLVDVLGQENAEQESETVTEAAQLQLWTNWAQKLVNKRALPREEQIVDVPISKLFSNETLKQFSSLFDGSDLSISKNGVCTFEGDSIDNPGWINGYMKPLHYLAQIGDKWILIDQGEAEGLLKGKAPCKTLWLVNHGVLISEKGLVRGAFNEDEVFCQRELIAKVLNGDLLFDEPQWKLFCFWVEKMDVEKKRLLKQFFEQVLFNVHPLLQSSAEYNRAQKTL